MPTLTESDRMRIRELYTTARYDDRPAIDDLCEVADGITAFVQDRGGVLRVRGRELVRVLLHYIAFRSRTPFSLIACRRPVRRPKNWLRCHETAWLMWVEDTFTAPEWDAEVMYSVFGTDTRSWEAVIPTWREEIRAFLPYWLDRTFDPIEEPLDDEEEEDSEIRDLHTY
jgi:hypothetical protein